MPTVFTAPEAIPAALDAPTVFLAGSIEQGSAVDWQRSIIDALFDRECVLFNPRRTQWNKALRQSIDEPAFAEQVRWELDALDRATIIAMFLSPETLAPISLLELGLFARSGRLVVACPEGFWRKGNVEVVCDRFGVQLVDSLAGLTEALRSRLPPRAAR
jgi:hypothetical protein